MAVLDRPGHSRGASVAGAGGGEMTMVSRSSKAAKDNALFGRIRQSSHCQQEEQSRACGCSRSAVRLIVVLLIAGNED